MAGRFDRAAVEGLPQAIAAFKRAPEVLRDRLGDATLKTSFQLLQMAKARVPVRFGFLKEALDYSYSTKTGVAMVGIRRGMRFTIPGTKRLTKYSGWQSDTAIPSKYGHLVEFGHGGPRPAAPHPFMIPSAEAQKDNYLTLCREAGKLAEKDLSTVGGRLL